MQNKKSKLIMTTKTMVYCAMLVALSVALARLAGLMPNEFTRFSIEAVPIFLAGLFFGPMAGGCVGFAADFVGCLFSAFGYNPIYCIPPILYGVCGGLLRFWIAGKPSFFRLLLAFLPPIAIGSIAIQSCVLAFMQYGTANFRAGLIYFLTTRSVQFAIMLFVNTTLVWLLIRSRLFDRIGIWPPTPPKKKESNNECN